MRQTWNEEECTSSPGTGEEFRKVSEQETAPTKTGEEGSPFVTLKRRTKQVPRNNQELGRLQTLVPMEGRFGDKTSNEEDRDHRTPPVGLESGECIGNLRKGDDDMDRGGTSDGAREENSGRKDLRGEEDMVLGGEAGRRRNEGSQCSEGEKKSGGGQRNKEDRSLNSQPDTDLTKSTPAIVADDDSHPPQTLGSPTPPKKLKMEWDAAPGRERSWKRSRNKL
jgi:hypothetical protein